MNFDVAIIGSGLAGLSVALNLAETRRVAILAKRSVSEGASDWAQGGIAAVLDSADSIDNHVGDTLIAGGGLCDEAATRFIVENGRAAIEWLIGEGVPFTKDLSAELGFHLTREGGHSHRRIIHAADATGHAVVSTLNERVRNHPNITVLEDHYAIDLITSERLGLPGHRCHGLYALDLASGRTVTIEAPHTVLATGGAGKVYLYTTNPDTATGDGIAMAWRAGCRVSNMEFIQFHPTCLFHPQAKSFLISEAVRGEGGVLRNSRGEDFMKRYDPRGSLAARDIVARAIDAEIKRSGAKCVFLDITHKSPEFLQERFPHIYQTCLRFGIDISKQPIPVVPAAHYQCGGIKTDVNGATSLSGLYAIGEVACTGLHGANRLASNSLLEGVVVPHRAAEAWVRARSPSHAARRISLPEWESGNVQDVDELVVIYHNWDEIRRLMWDYVGIVRTDKRLQRASARLR